MILDPRGPSIEFQSIVRRDDLVVELCKTRKPTRSALFDKAVLISDLLKAVSYKNTYLDNDQVNRLYQRLIEAADIFDYPVAPVLPTVTIPTVGSTIIVDGVTGVTGDVDINSSGISSINAGVIVNDDINAAAGIALSKLAALTASRALVSDGSGIVSVSAVTNTELGHLTGVTSPIQTQLNAKIGTTLASANIIVGNGSNVATAVAMTGDVTISNAGVTSIGTGVIVNADVSASAGIALSKLAALTASRAAVTDGSGFMTTSTVTATELGYVSGVTSSIQTQLNAKQATITGGATTIVSSNLTASRALTSDGAGKVAVSLVTATELGYLTGVTSALQTQLDSKQPDIQFQDEGVSAGSSGGVSTVNFTGSGVTASEAAGTLTVNIPGTSNGLPTGGVAGNYLRKSSGTDFDAAWDTFTISDVTDITATAAEINALAGAGVSATEMSFLGGVTGDIQSQLDAKLSQTLSYGAIWTGNISNIATPLSIGSNGHVLTVVGGVPTWQAPGSGGTVTSVAASGGTTGMSFTGSPITTSGTLTLTGTLALANGGTGASLAYPLADRIMFWDNSAGQTTWLSLGPTLSITGTTIDIDVKTDGGDLSDSNVQYQSSSKKQRTEFLYPTSVDGTSWSGAFNQTNVLNMVPNNSIIVVRATFSGVQTSGTVGSSGFYFVIERAFRRTTTTTTAVGSLTTLSSANDTGDSFTLGPTLTTSGGNINFERTMTTTKTFKVSLKLEVTVLEN